MLDSAVHNLTGTVPPMLECARAAYDAFLSAWETADDGGLFVPNQLMLLPPSAFFIIGFMIWALRAWKREQMETPEYSELKVRPDQRADIVGTRIT